MGTVGLGGDPPYDWLGELEVGDAHQPYWGLIALGAVAALQGGFSW